jgi:membrane protein YqaA with SNARE-associated domain
MLASSAFAYLRQAAISAQMASPDIHFSKPSGMTFAAHPPDVLEFAIIVGCGTAGGCILGSCFMVIIGALFGRRLESYLIDAFGGLMGIVAGLFLGLLIPMAFGAATHTADPQQAPLTIFGVIVGSLMGGLQGWILGVGVRHLLVPDARAA